MDRIGGCRASCARDLPISRTLEQSSHLSPNALIALRDRHAPTLGLAYFVIGQRTPTAFLEHALARQQSGVEVPGSRQVGALDELPPDGNQGCAGGRVVREVCPQLIPKCDRL